MNQLGSLVSLARSIEWLIYIYIYAPLSTTLTFRKYMSMRCIYIMCCMCYRELFVSLQNLDAANSGEQVAPPTNLLLLYQTTLGLLGLLGFLGLNLDAMLFIYTYMHSPPCLLISSKIPVLS